ncbi:hypothetical protein F4802DRAFT_566711 [Xylaria palmicola]|nr:hypothetical protein F4802DRAFT_566711 [Xylaria palmicola]
MPVPIAAKAGIIAVSVAVAAAIAVYESPEIQRMANDLRRRIAIALHAFGDSISPQERENLFNRPEDAEGFLQSRGLGRGSMPGVDADAESLRRQREELMYWNAVRESKKETGGGHDDEKGPHRSRASTRSSHFEDFLRQDASGEKGAYVYHQTGREGPNDNGDGLIRRRGTDGLRGLRYSIATDPFADEHGIEDDVAFENSLMDPEKDEMSDIYSATDISAYQPSRTLSPSHREEAPTPTFPTLSEVTAALPMDASHFHSHPQPVLEAPAAIATAAASSERELAADEYMTAGQEGGSDDAYSSIQAWAAQQSVAAAAASASHHTASFYSPLPASPAPASEASDEESFADGGVTPTDSASLAGSGVDIDMEAASARSFGVRSGSSGADTPTSWTDVESAAGESEGEGVGQA